MPNVEKLLKNEEFTVRYFLKGWYHMKGTKIVRSKGEKYVPHISIAKKVGKNAVFYAEVKAPVSLVRKMTALIRAKEKSRGPK